MTPYLLGLGDLPKRLFAYRAIQADCLDVQQTSVGLKADRPQRGQVMQPFADVEVPGVVEGRLGAQGAAFLVVLLVGSNGTVKSVKAKEVRLRRADISC